MDRVVGGEGRTGMDDVRSEEPLLNISCETENLVEYCFGKFAGFARKKNDYEKFYVQFGKRLKRGNHQNST